MATRKQQALVFGERLKEAREEAKLSQAQLAKMTGYSHQSGISNLEQRPRSVPRADKIAAIASALGVRQEWLLNAEGEKHPFRHGMPSDRALIVAAAFDGLPEPLKLAVETVCNIKAPEPTPMRRKGDLPVR